ncbi:unnamed protein product [Caenorhabditis sp. 36 PRJEB53466]|nr:unnamed protein product [Caenorhabditis sp. 36 PRJEB53466]
MQTALAYFSVLCVFVTARYHEEVSDLDADLIMVSDGEFSAILEPDAAVFLEETVLELEPDDTGDELFLKVQPKPSGLVPSESDYESQISNESNEKPEDEVQ